MPTRLDRVLTLCMQRTLPRRKGCLPILMYHSISGVEETGVHPYYRVATSPSRFDEQMRWLAEGGWRGLSLEEALPMFLNGQCDDSRPVALTFDDGFRDFYTAAWPLLQRHQFTATMYLPTGFIGSRRGSFRGRECLTWNEVRELRGSGIRFGSHTVSHPVLHQLAWQAIESELSISKACLEQELGEEISSFAYPYAYPQEDAPFTERLTEVARGRGYRSCVTTVVGLARGGDDPFRLRRLPVNSSDDRVLFRAKIEGAYDWLSWVQRATRHWKRWRGVASKSKIQRRSQTRAAFQ
jgi:peptidoglycan/xylan/chitin deacetylase (PgdA/CDA1 family)